jgi:hypothetical protein
MPPFAVASAMQIRGWDANEVTGERFYALCNFFGVGYRALLNHMHFTLRLISQPMFDCLSKDSPKSIRSKLCPNISTPHLVIVDKFWRDRPVDLEVDDIVVLPAGARIDGELLESISTSPADGIMAHARKPGIARIFDLPDTHSLLLRVNAREYIGFAHYRFPEFNNVYGIT